MTKNFTQLFIALLFTTAILFFGFKNNNENTVSKLQIIGAPTQAENRQEIEDWQNKMLADPATGFIPVGIRVAELQFAKRFLNNNSANKNKQLDPWTLRGPWNVGGRTRAFAIDVNSDSILFAGGVSGGLWRSTDMGNSWTRVTNKYDDPDVVSIVQDTRVGHTNTWYYSSGEPTGTSASGGNSFYLGNGVFKSTDGGLTWDSLTATNVNYPNAFVSNYQLTWGLAIDTKNMAQNVVYLSAYGTIYRSADGGTTWAVTKSSSNSYYTDVAVDTSSVVYATFSSDGAAPGIFRSTNGTTWTNILPSNFQAKYGLTKIGINPQNHNEVYFLVSNTDTTGSLSTDVWGVKEYTGLWKYTYLSGNGTGSGSSWTNLSNNLPQTGLNKSFDGYHSQGGYNVVIKVHPTLPNTIFIGGTNIYRSTDGFTTALHTTQIGGYAVGTTMPFFKLYANHHPDQHDIQFSKSNPNRMFSACDGGVYKTDTCTNALVRWTKLDRGYFTTQFYTAQLSPDYVNAPDIVFGGLQDNGIFWTNTSNVTTPWHMPFNGDGSWLDMSNDGQTYYLSVQEGKVIKAQLDNTGTITQFARIDPIYASRSDYQFVNPFVIDRANDNIMYVPAGRKLFRNNDLSSIPFAGNTDSIATNWVQYPDTLTGSNTFTAIACSKNNHTLYVGTANQKVYRIDNANIGSPHMVDITGTNFPGNPSGGLYVSCLAVDPNNANKVTVVFSNYNINSIYYSLDAGTTWISVSGNLEQNSNGSGNGPSIRWISILPFQGHNKYFCGTSIGLFSADSLTLSDFSNAGTQWVQEGADVFGNTIVPHIFIREADNMVAVATHGSGIYTTHYGWNVGVGSIANAASAINVYPNPATNKVKISWQSKSNNHINLLLFDLNGKLIFEQQNMASSIGKNAETIDVSSLSSGVYLLNMNDGKENFNQKIVVSR